MRQRKGRQAAGIGMRVEAAEGCADEDKGDDANLEAFLAAPSERVRSGNSAAQLEVHADS